MSATAPQTPARPVSAQSPAASSLPASSGSAPASTPFNTRIDLNLLQVLQVLLEECSVTRAAGRLHLSQSAVSKSLARLRVMFDDALFIRERHGLRPTARALSLRGELAELLSRLENLSAPATFTPATSQRRFQLAVLESAWATLMPSCTRTLTDALPHGSLEISRWQADCLSLMEKGQLDIGLAGHDHSAETPGEPPALPAGFQSRLLWRDDHVILVRRDHPLTRRQTPMTLSEFAALSHVQATCEGRSRWSLDERLEQHGAPRRISVLVPDFRDALSIVAHSELVFCAPRSFAQASSELHGLAILELPMRLPALSYRLIWHASHEQDPGHRWLRKSLLTHIRNAHGEDAEAAEL
ncbi:MAG: LysR family transcriptional regulator [Cobetia sp.]|mgnify:FL=1|uniref:LysR family transcriptional regulator n=1 Tax=Cobetia TaxID=204286 RepID=UPI000C5B3297|nr:MULTISPECIES: LysR family transcriptional regulator [Cobetia]MBK08178.1 LysR family transcriptional regulator [Cobetia sp.]WOI27015.1 LysR family transcriptional regulator [Cobetia amphilecti]HAR09299.1 LysR family transcriptional regulator [Cobetia sp.]